MASRPHTSDSGQTPNSAIKEATIAARKAKSVAKSASKAAAAAKAIATAKEEDAENKKKAAAAAAAAVKEAKASSNSNSSGSSFADLAGQLADKTPDSWSDPNNKKKVIKGKGESGILEAAPRPIRDY